jgi:hypothetical protein
VYERAFIDLESQEAKFYSEKSQALRGALADKIDVTN